MLKDLEEIFNGTLFLKNTIIVVTKWHMNVSKIIERKSKGISEKSVAN